MIKTTRAYLLNPNKDPIKEAVALYGQHSSNGAISKVDAVVRGSFSLATSIIKGTFKFSTKVAKSLNKNLHVTHKIRNVVDTLIGTNNNDELIKFGDDVRKDVISKYRSLSGALSIAATGNPNADPKDIAIEGSSAVVKAMKRAALSAAGRDLGVHDLVNNSIVVDIETGGLFKHAPIVQLAMADQSRAHALRGLSEAQIGRMSAKDQLDQGFLSLQLLPEAIIRDEAREGYDAAGNLVKRDPTYKAFTLMPRSAEEFEASFKEWALKKQGYKVKQFYDEFADETIQDPNDPTKTIRRLSDQRLIDIQDMMDRQGFISLSDGQRLYSQREAAKWSMIFAKQGSKENKNLVAANLSFESFRIGKLWSYFTEDRTGVTSGTDADFNLAMNTSSVNHLNDDADIIDAFGSALEGHKDVRSMLMATWRSKYKLNVLDENNYYFVDEARKLRAVGATNELIKLYPEYLGRLGGGLKATDQQVLTRMMFSGLMQTGHSRMSNDIFSGVKIEWSTKIVLGEEETHQALSDVLQQGRLLKEGKLAAAANDVFNVFQAQESTSIRDQFKSLNSVISILFDRKKKAWFDLDTVFRNTQIAGFEDQKVAGLMYDSGTASEIMKQWNIDKEILRIEETVDAYTGVTDSLYSQSSLGAHGRTFSIPDKNGLVLDVPVPTGAREPFSIGDFRSSKTHEMISSDGTSLKVHHTASDYNLPEEVQAIFNRHLNQGKTQDEAREETKKWLVDRYAATASVQSTGRTAADVQSRRTSLLGLFASDDERRKHLDDILSSGSKYIEEMITGDKAKGIKGFLEPMIDAAAKRATSDDPAMKYDFFHDAYTGAKQFVNVKSMSEVKDRMAAVRDIQLSTISSLPKNFIQKTFDVDEKMANWVLKHAARPLGLLGAAAGIGAIASADYLIDRKDWKKTTGELLKMTGEEKEILPEGYYKKQGSLSDVSKTYGGGNIDHTNPGGIAISEIDSSKVDYAVGDGDTLQVISKGFLGFGRKSLGSVRLAGMDTPETSHGGGSGPGAMPEAEPPKQYLTNVLSARTGSKVVVGGNKTYGRGVGMVVDESGINYSYETVNQGLGSVLYRETKYDDLMDQSAFNKAEYVAKKSEKGMWANPFYYGAQSGISGRERTGWNKLTPKTAKKFNFDRSPGSTEEQVSSKTAIEQQERMNNSINMLGQPGFGFSQESYNRKMAMAQSQQAALAGSMTRNRGRGKDRR
jgi:endonuclease YncB( thermonuclease family)